MATVNVFEAKSSLSKLIESIESGATREVVIARHGHPVARLVPIDRQPVARRIGVARGEFDVVPDRRLDAKVAKLFRSR
jgi:antitoxin (DNA-binding transcriptional repressor) of toxin-antitoxin stability system